MFQNLKTEIIDNYKRVYFGTCSCCGALFGIEFLTENTILYRCFGDKRIQNRCQYYTEGNIEIDNNGRCKNHSDCVLKESNIKDFQIDEVSYIIDLIHKYPKFVLSVGIMSITLQKILKIMEKDLEYSLFFQRIEDIFCFIFQKK